MPSAEHEVHLQASIDDVWAVAGDIDCWAPLMTGYIDHEKLSEMESLWTIKGVGPMSKTVTFQVKIIESVRPSTLRISLRATNANIEGEGCLSAQPTGPDSSLMKVSLNLRPAGAMAPILDALMKGNCKEGLTSP